MNNVSFKGLYVLTGKPENARTKRGEAISEIRMSKLEGFLNDTKPYRKENDVSYYTSNHVACQEWLNNSTKLIHRLAGFC